MAYYLGRDVKVYLTTESAECQVDVSANTVTTSDADEGVSGALDFATATITITDFTELNAGDKVNLVATDGTNYDFTNGDQSSVSGTWESTTSNNATATNLMNVINTSSGPAGTRFTATVDGAVVTVTQAVAGADGNTTVTLTESGGSGMSRTNFTGGAAYVLPYSQINGLAGYAPLKSPPHPGGSVPWAGTLQPALALPPHGARLRHRPRTSIGHWRH